MLCEQLLQLCVFLLIRITMVAFFLYSNNESFGHSGADPTGPQPQLLAGDVHGSSLLGSPSTARPVLLLT